MLCSACEECILAAVLLHIALCQRIEGTKGVGTNRASLLQKAKSLFGSEFTCLAFRAGMLSAYKDGGHAVMWGSWMRVESLRASWSASVACMANKLC